jgi:hypothetical protein
MASIYELACSKSSISIVVLRFAMIQFQIIMAVMPKADTATVIDCMIIGLFEAFNFIPILLVGGDFRP